MSNKSYTAVTASVVTAMFFCIQTVFWGCSKSPEEKYRHLLQKQQAGENISGDDLWNAYFKAFASVSFSEKVTFVGDNFVIAANDGALEIISPKWKYPVAEAGGKGISHGSVNDRFILLGNRKGFSIYNPEGEKKASFAGGKEEIDAMTLYFDEVIFMQDNAVKVYDIKTESVTGLGVEKFSSPYKKFFNSHLLANNGKLGVLCGIGGSYYLSVLDLETGKILIKDVTVSSSSFYIKGNSLFCVKGGSGSWDIYEYDLQTKNKNKILSMKEVDNMYFNDSFIVLKKGADAEFRDYGGKKLELGIKPDFYGIIRDGLILRHNSKLHIVLNSSLLKKDSNL